MPRHLFRASRRFFPNTNLLLPRPSFPNARVMRLDAPDGVLRRCRNLCLLAMLEAVRAKAVAASDFWTENPFGQRDWI